MNARYTSLHRRTFFFLVERLTSPSPSRPFLSFIICLAYLEPRKNVSLVLRYLARRSSRMTFFFSPNERRLTGELDLVQSINQVVICRAAADSQAPETNPRSFQFDI